MMTVEQFVMAYSAEQDRLRVLLSEGFASLRPVLRINAEVRDGKTGGSRVQHCRGKSRQSRLGQHRPLGRCSLYEGRQKDDLYAAGADDLVHRRRHRGRLPCGKGQRRRYYLKDGTFTLVPAEKITANKEFCDCEFAWRFAGGAHGVSLGKMLPAIPGEGNGTL